jgi:hypothetical protein
MLMDALFAILLVTILLTALIIATAHQRKATRALDDRRAAYRLAEDAANALLARQPLPASATVSYLPDPAPAGHAWARVSVPSASLITHAPSAASHPAGGPP